MRNLCIMQSRKSLFKGGIGYADGFAGSEGNGRGENFVQSDQPSSGEASRSQPPNSEAMLEILQRDRKAHRSILAIIPNGFRSDPCRILQSVCGSRAGSLHLHQAYDGASPCSPQCIEMHDYGFGGSGAADRRR